MVCHLANTADRNKNETAPKSITTHGAVFKKQLTSINLLTFNMYEPNYAVVIINNQGSAKPSYRHRSGYYHPRSAEYR